MIINRRTFNIKPGCMEAVVQLLLGLVDPSGPKPGDRPVRLSTAEFGPFDVLAMEIEYENLDQYQQYWKDVSANPRMVPFFEKWNTMVAGGGTNEVWEVVADTRV